MSTLGVWTANDPILPSLRLGARNLRAAVTWRPDPLRQQLGRGRSGDAYIRPIETADRMSWRESMRANHLRMERWWGLHPDFERAIDDVAYLQHRREWDRRLRRGYGACLGIFGPGGLIGEVQVWHLQPGGLTGEVGMWLSPQADASITDAAGCVGYAIDRLIDGLGLRRIDAPVAAENPLPRPLLRLAGFVVEARIPKWRELNGHLEDYDLFTLTPQRWHEARPQALAKVGQWRRDVD